MKYFIAFAAVVAVATSAVLKPVGNVAHELEAIIAAINSPSTDPATAALLEQQLQELMPAIVGPAIVDEFAPIAVGPAIVDEFAPIAVGPAIVDEFAPIAVGPAIVDEFAPISVGPALIDFPVPDGGAVTAVEPTPAVVAPVQDNSASSPPLVQIILNINAAQPGAVAITPELPKPDPVSVVDVAEVQEIPGSPVTVVESAPEPELVAEPIIPEPIQVAEPILPAPAVVLPDILN